MANVKSIVETITPTMAKKYLEKNNNNRKLNTHLVQYYAQMLSCGQWKLNGEAIIFDVKGNLIDGQHRLNAVVLANIPMQTLVTRNIECDPDTFSTINRGRGRTSSDVFGINHIPNSTSVSSAIRRFFIFSRMQIGSLTTTGKGSDRVTNKISDQDLLNVYFENDKFWQDEFSFASSCYHRCRLITSTEIMAISAHLQLTKGYNIDVVHNFFSQLFFEEETKNGTLSLLRRMFINDAMKANGIRMTTKYKTQLLIKSWEAFKKNKVYKKLTWSKDVDGELIFE